MHFHHTVSNAVPMCPVMMTDYGTPEREIRHFAWENATTNQLKDRQTNGLDSATYRN
jgi:hypothetical protein